MKGRIMELHTEAAERRAEIALLAHDMRGARYAHAVGELGEALSALRADVERVEADAARFEWWFGPKDKIEFVARYIDGVSKGFTVDQWRAAIDEAMKESG